MPTRYLAFFIISLRCNINITAKRSCFFKICCNFQQSNNRLNLLAFGHSPNVRVRPAIAEVVLKESIRRSYRSCQIYDFGEGVYGHLNGAAFWLRNVSYVYTKDFGGKFVRLRNEWLQRERLRHWIDTKMLRELPTFRLTVMSHNRWRWCIRPCFCDFYSIVNK